MPTSYTNITSPSAPTYTDITAQSNPTGFLVLTDNFYLLLTNGDKLVLTDGATGIEYTDVREI